MSAPLCETKEIPPGAAREYSRAAMTFSATLAKPAQFGPRMCILSPKASISSCRARPPAPASANPALMTTACRIPASTQSASTPGTATAGTVMTARSAFPSPSSSGRTGRSAREARQACPKTSLRLGFTAYRVTGEAARLLKISAG